MKNLNELTLLEAIDGLKNKEFTSVDLIKACYFQIEKYQELIKPFVTLVDIEISLEHAKSADKIISEKGLSAFESRPLLGIPYSCKDNYSTVGIQTTASSKILEGYIPVFESTVTHRLKDAGAILIAKDNMDAFAHGGSTETSDFFTTRNPWDTTRVPGGSSGGTAAAVSSDMVIFGIGEDTGGSIRCPASWCGITGLKSTYGRVSRYGVIAMASSTDSPGPMTKSAADCALVLKVISGKDYKDATSSTSKVLDYLDLAGKYDLSGKVIGIPKSFFHDQMDVRVVDAVKNAINKLEELGAVTKEIDLLDPKYSLAVYTIVQRAEVSSNLARFDGIRFGHSRDTFGFEARKRMMLGAYVLSVGYYDAYYTKAQKVRSLLKNNFEEIFKKVDLIVGPTLPSVAVKIGDSAASPMWGELIDMLQDPTSMTGLPSLSVPCGFVDGLPVGMQIIAPMFEENKILGAAYVYQQNTDYHLQKPVLS